MAAAACLTVLEGNRLFELRFTDRRRFRIRVRVADRVNIAGNDSAAFDLDFPVADFARDFARGADGEALADVELALEMAADVGGFAFRRSLEMAGAGDFDGLAFRERIRVLYYPIAQKLKINLISETLVVKFTDMPKYS